VIAHRGASAYRPENTPSAFELAVDQGADMLEVDLHFTRDREIVISHDAELARFGRSGEIQDLNLAELSEIDAGEGQQIPTLAELLDGFGGRIDINLEIKQPARGLYGGIEAATLAAVRERGLLPSVLFSSFDDPVLRELRRLSSQARIAVLASFGSRGEPVVRAQRVAAEAVNPAWQLLNETLALQLVGAGLAIYPYTVDSVDEMERLLALGACGLFTNRPDRMRAVVDR